MEKGIQKIMNSKKDKLLEKLKNKKYRDAFVSEMIDTGIPFQIRALRKQRNWTQKDLSEKTGMMQERISVLEDPNYGKLTLTTMKKLASAMNIGLLVRFVSISELVKWELALSPDSLKVMSYDEDPYFKTKEDSHIGIGAEQQTPSLSHEKVFYLASIGSQEKNEMRVKYLSKQKSDQDIKDSPALKLSMGG